MLNEDPESPYYTQIPYELRNEVAKLIPTVKTLDDLGEEVEKEVLLKDILGKSEQLSNVYDKFPLWFKYVMRLEGLPKSMGRHAAGTLITPKPVIEYCPLCMDREGNQMCQLEMHNAMDDLSLVKMDFLGLENLDTIDDTLKMAGLTWKDVDINHLDLNDKAVYDAVYKSGHTIGIFQMESAEARKMCVEAKCDNAEDIIVVNAANRPGTKDSFPTYCSNKLHPETIKLLHPDIKQLFAKTQYILLYQEQALAVFRYAGFPETEVDNARRAIGKKKKDVFYIPVSRKLIRGVAASAAAVALFFVVSTPVKEVNLSAYTASFVPTEMINYRFEEPISQLEEIQVSQEDEMVAEVTPKIEATKETEIAKAASAPEVKKELVAPAPKVKSVAPKKMYHIVIASFPTEEQANEYISGVDRAQCKNVSKVVRDGKYRIYADKFNNRADAESYMATLRKIEKYKDAWLFISR